jgi:enoyl-CoA hydratase/carnithine racemase
MINTELKNKVLTITMARTDKKNALTQQMYKDMAIAIEGASEQGARAILIQGSGGCFTAGNDIKDFLSEDGKQELTHTYRFMNALLHCPLPVIAKVQGLAIGIGTTLLLHCDFVYCDESAKFSMPFINLGMVPEFASSFILPRLCGSLKAAELLLLGEMFSAADALEYKIVSKVVASGELEHVVEQTLAKIVAKPSWAMQQSKALLRNQKEATQAHMDKELKIFAQAFDTPAAKEAFTAFLEKRAVNTDVFK